MAIYTIPTSISGVSIPGALIDGPLGALFGKKYDLPYYQYPRDLESATRGHVIQFTIQEVDPVSYEEAKNFLVNSYDNAKDAISSAIDNPSATFDSAIDGVKKFVNDKQGGSFTTSNLTFAQPKTKSAGVISLYIPDTVNFQYGASYTDPSILDVAGSVPIVGKFVENVTSAVTSAAAQTAMRAAGYAINPQQQLLFQGIGFRTYQMAFTFTPYSKAESDSVVEIIKMFKKHAMPKVVPQSAGMFFIPPSMFDVKILFNGAENTKINKIARSVIESIDVNYAPNGWTAHTDGAPVQTTLTVNFKEMVLLDRSMIEQGY